MKRLKLSFGIIAFLLILFIFLGFIAIGFLFLLSYLLKFDFQSRLDYIYFLITFGIGIGLLIPFDLFVNVFIKVKCKNNKLLRIGSEVIQFLFLVGFLKEMNRQFTMIAFPSITSELILYGCFYLAFMSFGLFDDKEKEIHDKPVSRSN